MCDPVSIAIGAQAAGSVVQGIGAKQSADAQAGMQTAAAGYDADLIRRRGMQQVGQASVMRGKSGVALEGSPLDALAQAAANVELDARARLWSGKVAAQASKQRGNAALLNGFFGAGKALAGADLFGGGGGGLGGSVSSGINAGASAVGGGGGFSAAPLGLP